MYRIFVDDECLYHPGLTEEGLAVLSGTVSLEMDKTGSAEITIPPTNPLYNTVAKMKSMVQVMDDDEEIFRGRVLHDTMSFDRSKKLYVEGELGFLIDNIRSPYSITGSVAAILGSYISTYNEQVEPTKRFTVGTVTVDPGTITVGSRDYPNFWDEINRQLVTPYGGHIRTRLEGGVRYIDYLSDYSRVCGQTIEFGVNLLDIEEYISAEDLVTVLIPLGKDLGGENGRVNIYDVNIIDGEHQLYLRDQTAQALYGNIWATAVWDDVTDPATLKTLGEAHLAKIANPLKTMSIRAVDLNFAGIQADRIRLGDRIRVVSRPHGIDALYQCTKMSINLLNPASSTYTFGDIRKTLTGTQAETEAEAKTAVQAAESAGTAAENASEAAARASQDIGTLGTKPVCVLSAMEPVGVADNYALAGNGLAVSDSSSRICVYEVLPGQVVSIKASKDNAGVFQWQNARTTPTSGSPSTLVGDPVTAAFDGLAAAPEGASYLAVSQAKGNSTNYIGKPSKGTLA